MYLMLLVKYSKYMKYNVELKLYQDTIDGVEFSFLDSYYSWAVDEIFIELNNNPYGINNVNLTSDDIVIDVGANVGMFSIFVQKKFGCKIIAFEPVKENIDNFRRNILLNNLNPDNFEIYNLAITGNKDDVVNVGIKSWNSGGCSIFYRNPGNSVEVVTDTLHNYVNKNCKFLKLDCEGSEYEIIPSILDIINTFEYIGIEYHEIGNNLDPNKFHKMLKENFNGKIFPETIGYIPKIESSFL